MHLKWKMGLAALAFGICMTSVMPVKAMTGTEAGVTYTIEKNDSGTTFSSETMDSEDSFEISESRYYDSNSADWSVYSSTYQYNQLTEKEKAVYDDLFNDAVRVMESGGSAEKVEALFPLSEVNLDSAQKIAWVFRESNPQFFFLKNSISYGYMGSIGKVSLPLYTEFQDGSARSMAVSNFKLELSTVQAEVEAQSTDYEKGQAIYNWIINHCTYEENEYDQSAYSVVVQRRSVCEGYSMTYIMLSNAAGIQTVHAQSNTHAWVKTNLYDGWYAVDPTWGQSGDNCLYVSDADLIALDRGSSSHRESRKSYYTPACQTAFKPAAGIGAYGKDVLYVTYSGEVRNAGSIYDYATYMAQNSDLSALYSNNPAAAARHFVNYGMKEGRTASTEFNPVIYLNNYLDLYNAFGSNYKSYYLHYLNNGIKEGRNASVLKTNYWYGTDYSPVYDFDIYCKNRPDVVKAFGYDRLRVFKHFLNYGMQERAIAKSDFDPMIYRNNYPDLNNAYGNNWKQYYLHYTRYGVKEGRNASVQRTNYWCGVDYSAVFNPLYYARYNPDVSKALGNSTKALLGHFVNYGMKEGRNAIPSFSPSVYRARYSDLNKAFGNNWSRYYLHYINYGLKEGRKAS